MPTPRALVPAALLALAALTAGACGDDGETAETGSGGSGSGTSPEGQEDTVVRVVTHDSFALSRDMLAAFTDETGIEVEILSGDDAGSVVNQAVLSAGEPQGDDEGCGDDRLRST